MAASGNHASGRAASEGGRAAGLAALAERLSEAREGGDGFPDRLNGLDLDAAPGPRWRADRAGLGSVEVWLP